MSACMSVAKILIEENEIPLNLHQIDKKFYGCISNHEGSAQNPTGSINTTGRRFEFSFDFFTITNGNQKSTMLK